jgi:hypothetical protein
VQDWFAGEEAAGCLFLMFGERREVVHAGSGVDCSERHVWRFEGGGVVVVVVDGCTWKVFNGCAKSHQQQQFVARSPAWTWS